MALSQQILLISLIREYQEQFLTGSEVGSPTHTHHVSRAAPQYRETALREGRAHLSHRNTFFIKGTTIMYTAINNKVLKVPIEQHSGASRILMIYTCEE